MPDEPKKPDASVSEADVAGDVAGEIQPSREVLIARAAVDLAFARAAGEWRRIIAEDQTELLRKVDERLELQKEAIARMVRKLRDDLTAQKIQVELAATPTGKAESAIVLVVDDAPPIRILLRRLLESRGMRVHDADGPERAMRLLDVEPIDVVLADIRMPKNGTMLFEYVRSSHPGCEVVLMSGGEESEAADKALESGAFDFITKPFRTNEQVVLTITRAAEHRKLRRHGPRR